MWGPVPSARMAVGGGGGVPKGQTAAYDNC